MNTENWTIPTLIPEDEPFDNLICRRDRYNRTMKCLHVSCKECNGTGFKKNGLGACVHMISCPCAKCCPTFL